VSIKLVAPTEPKNTPSLSQLARQAQHGDQRAYEEVIRQSRKLIRYKLRRMGAHPHLMEDLVQDVLVDVVRNLHVYRPRWSYSTWVTALARNCFLHYLAGLNTKKRQRPDSIQVELDKTVVPDLDWDKPFSEIERAHQNRQLMEMIRARCHDVEPQLIQLFFEMIFNGSEPTYLVEKYQVSRSTVNNARTKCVRRLKNNTTKVIPYLDQEIKI
jgi:RNA polymerase sigma factor (sigma-70 family)